MAAYAESTPSMTSKTSKLSVYQTNGKPLSVEAIYRAKMKYGIYDHPARVNLGVDPSASDTAALLAANTDLSIESYSRDLSADAATAALYAKGEAPTAWTRKSIAPEAEYAAISAKSLKFPFSSKEENTHFEDSEGAAAAALNMNSKSSLQDLYDFDEIRTGKATISEFTNISTNKSLKSLSTKSDFRSGITTSMKANEGSRKINMANITKAATESATKTMTSRMDPAKNFRSGLKTISKPNNTSDTSIYIKDIYSQSEKASKVATQQKKTKSYGLQTPSDDVIAFNPASFAAGALKGNLNIDYAYNERESLKDNSLVDPKVYAYAAQKAEEALKKLDDDAATNSLFSNRKFNEQAYKIALSNAEKRRAENKPGNIQLGGGLTMNAKDINLIAQSLVNPALLNMNEQISKMKSIDAEKKQLPEKIKQREIEHRSEIKARQIALEKKRTEEATSRRSQLKDDKKSLDDEQILLQDTLGGEFEALGGEFDQQKETEADQMKEIDDERAEKKKVLDDAKAEKDGERNAELEEMQKEKDEDVAPISAELEEEQSKLADLTSTRQEKESFFNEHKLRVDNAQSELDELLEKLKILEERENELTGHINETEGVLATETSAKEEIEGKLNTEGASKEAEVAALQKEMEGLEVERQALHTVTSEKRAVINDLQTAHYEEHKAINEIYPDHLKKEISAPEDVHDDDLANSKFELDTSSIKEPPEIESEPEVENEDVWPKQPTPEPETEESADIPKVTAPARPAVQKKTWEELKAQGLADGDDPLLNVPTNEKPPMVAVVNTNDVQKTVEHTSAMKRAFRASKKAAKTIVTPPERAPVKNVKPVAKETAVATEEKKVPVIKSGATKKNFFGIFGGKKEQKQDFVVKTQPKKTEDASKKYKGLEKNSPNTETKEVENTAKPTTKPVTETSAAAADDDMFSGFSQGSEVAEEEK